MKVFLDDLREPEHCYDYMFKRIAEDNYIYYEPWKIVRNYHEFKKYVSNFYNIITHISFDHDLGEDVAKALVQSGISKRQARNTKKTIKNGYDCAKWMKEYYLKKKTPLPIMFIHSMNPIGTQNIINLFK